MLINYRVLPADPIVVIGKASKEARDRFNIQLCCRDGLAESTRGVGKYEWS